MLLNNTNTTHEKPASLKEFKKETYAKSNMIVSNLLNMLLFVLPTIIICKKLHFFQDENMAVCFKFLIISACILGIFHLSKMIFHNQQKIIAYIGLTAMSIMIGSLWIGDNNIYLTWFFVPLLSLIYCERHTYLYASIMNYIIMGGSIHDSIHIRAYRTISYLPEDKWFVDTMMGFTIEYICMFVVGYFICCILRECLSKIYTDTVILSTKEAEINRDKLTGLWNTKYFKEIYPEINKQNCAFVIIDMDNFKQVNDTFGHLEGDRALTTFAKTFNCIDDVIASRFGGDEFILLIPNISDVSDLEYKLHLIQKTANNTFYQDEHFKDLCFSAGGVYITNDTNLSYYEAFSIADKCLLDVKRNNKNDFKYIEV